MKLQDKTRALSHTARGVKAASTARARATLPEKFRGACRIFLQCVCDTPMCRSPKFARACGRVSIGRHPDKRPDSRLRFANLRASLRDRQPEAKPAHPALNGGRGLKQRRSGLFWSLAVQRSTPKRLVHLAGRAERVLPLQSKAASSAEAAARLHRVPNARQAPSASAVDAGRCAQARSPEHQRWANGDLPLGSLEPG